MFPMIQRQLQLVSVFLLGLLATTAFPATEKPARGKRIALLVGVKEYTHDGFPDLHYSENDVDHLATLLRRHGYDVILLTTALGKKNADLHPTAVNIRKRLTQLLHKRAPGDILVVGLSGHGCSTSVKIGTETKQESFFCPADVRLPVSTELSELSKTLLGFTELFKKLDSCTAGAKILLIDACRNDRTKARARRVGLAALPHPPRGTAALFSCKPGEAAFEISTLGSGHGLFFHFILEGLRGKAKNEEGQVTWDGLSEFVRKQVSRQAPVLLGNGARQTPHEIRNIEGESPVLITLTKTHEIDDLFRRAHDAYHARGREANWPEALSLARQAADRGHSSAQVFLGLCAARGLAMKKDLAESRQWCSRGKTGLIAAAEQGDAVAKYLLGVLYAEGIGVEKNAKQALKWLERSAEKSCASAMVWLGIMHLDGRGVKQNVQEAVKWFRLGAEQKDAESETMLGIVHLGIGSIPADVNEVVKWIRRAAERGYPPAQNRLGILYADGVGVKHDPREAARWFRKAAEQGEANAQNNLGAAYAVGKGVSQDDSQAVVWYRKAAEKGLANAQVNLGTMYLQGKGVELAHQKAVELYRKAAEQGNALAQYNLGGMYLSGLGVARDYQQAMLWLRRAAEQDLGLAQIALAKMYENGLGVRKDLKEAKRWYDRAKGQRRTVVKTRP